jgi:hypothetical protein
MNDADLLQILAHGEDSRHQFKRDETNTDSITVELAAFANSGGGLLLPGVDDNGRVTGLDTTDVRRLNQLILNAASQNVRPPIHPMADGPKTKVLKEGKGPREWVSRGKELPQKAKGSMGFNKTVARSCHRHSFMNTTLSVAALSLLDPQNSAQNCR